MRFKGLTAVNGFSASLERGKIYGLIGTNGAGKTTLINILSGQLKPNEGGAKLEGRQITGARPDIVARMGGKDVPEPAPLRKDDLPCKRDDRRATEQGLQSGSGASEPSGFLKAGEGATGDGDGNGGGEGVDLTYVLVQMVNGLKLGSVYAIVATGYCTV